MKVMGTLKQYRSDSIAMSCDSKYSHSKQIHSKYGSITVSCVPEKGIGYT